MPEKNNGKAVDAHSLSAKITIMLIIPDSYLPMPILPITDVSIPLPSIRAV